jgi:hypothetical protein
LSEVRELVTSVSAALTWIEKLFVAVLPAASDKSTVNWNVPEVVGMPFIWAAFRLNPGGNAPPDRAHV